MKRFYVVSGTKEKPVVETVRTDRNTAKADVGLFRTICHKRTRIEEQDPRPASAS